MSSSVDEKDHKIIQEYYISVAGLLKIAVIFYRTRFLQYCQNAIIFVVSK